ncbi:primosomal protein N' [Flavobacterium agricola]|uniref:Replication restart protein PriA n=1 Tax=Flavobacterium agricola TaxID=2870839 RepID=A0ABY6M2W6_9FLAO|nr:primosomal protein N' [Flavobacterium agricola]UYW02172.1 primosomal protein N' [Flavobacterium agricola]
MSFFIDVIIPLSLPQTFTYQVTLAEFEFLDSGFRVMVPFGKNKYYTALVTAKHQNALQKYEAKDIFLILDEKPLVTPQQLQLWQFIAAYYMCNIGDVFTAAVPSVFLLQSETVVQINAEEQISIENLTDNEYLIVQALEQQASLKITEIQQILNKKDVFKPVQSLLEKQVITLAETVVEKYKPKQLKYIQLAAEFANDKAGLANLLAMLNRSEKQRQLVLAYYQLIATNKQVLAKDLIEKSQTSSAVLRTMVTKNIFEEYFENQDRVVFDAAVQTQINLSKAQTIALNQIQESFSDHTTTLLHGVTASGKTEIYIKLIEQYLAQNKQILFLLPEIALTTQLVSRLTAYFGNDVAVYHSKYSNNERAEVWQQVLEQSPKAKVVIGARSAIFLPFSNLGLIVIDEEHEQTYKQFDPAPRYHARDTAIMLAHIHQAKVLLGSATPSLETYYNTVQKKYGKVELTKRFNNVVLPDIELIDLTEKYKRKQMIGHFSDKMIDAIRDKLALGEQVIVLQNRRGYSPYVECNACGNVPHCVNCDVSLTYYKFSGNLRCNYCGHTESFVKRCVKCHATDVNTKGFGTEQIESELLEFFPNIKIARMDQDTTRGKNAFEKMLDQFKNKEIDVLVGTQMLAKGLHFDNVTLVCVPNADNMLHIPDFRSHERAFQLLVQVAGRAGRADKKGLVMIQTYNPYHNVIQQVCNNDYLGMYKEQLYERSNFKYPPFYRLIKITLKHKDVQKLKSGSFWLYNALMQQFPNFQILGPEEPAVNKIKNEYIRTILFKISNKEHLGNTKKTLQRTLQSFDSISEYRSIKISLNVDFY